MSIYGSSNISTSGLVLYVDFKNTKSYRGMPKQNLLTGITSWNGTVDSANYKISDALEEVYIPALNKTYTARSVKIYNNDPGNSCCPSLLQYGWPASTSFLGSTLYTYTILYRIQTGWTGPNYMYHYEYGPSGYITEYGVHNDSLRTPLGDNWYFAWNNFTTNANTNTMYFGSWYYQYGRFDKYTVAAVNLIQGNYVIPPDQMLGSGETRTNTNSLLDLAGSNTFDLTNLSYDGYGQPTYNGSNSYIISPENSALNTQTVTVEVWVKTNATTQNGFWFEKGQVNSQYSLFQEGVNIIWRQNLSGGLTSLIAPAASYMNTSNWAQVVGTYTSGQRRLYVNGVLVASDATTGTINTNANGSSIGVYGGYNGGRGYYYNGLIDIVKVYNRVLSPDEVLQNYNANKSRFGL